MDARPWPFVATDQRGAAEATGASVSSIKEAAASGDLVVHYLGAKPLYRAADLDEWVESLPTTSPRERARLAG